MIGRDTKMTQEIVDLVSQSTYGVYEAVSIGHDYVGFNMTEAVVKYTNYDCIHLVIVVDVYDSHQDDFDALCEYMEKTIVLCPVIGWFSSRARNVRAERCNMMIPKNLDTLKEYVYQIYKIISETKNQAARSEVLAFEDRMQQFGFDTDYYDEHGNETIIGKMKNALKM